MMPRGITFEFSFRRVQVRPASGDDDRYVAPQSVANDRAFSKCQLTPPSPDPADFYPLACRGTVPDPGENPPPLETGPCRGIRGFPGSHSANATLRFPDGLLSM